MKTTRPTTPPRKALVMLGFHLSLLIFPALFAEPARAADAPAKPNIIVIMADDLGYGSLGCYGADPKLVRTPNCDRLASGGMRFTDANTTSSVCSPTRYSLLTGRYCWRTSLKSKVAPRSPMLVETNRLTMPSLLKKQGYSTALIGKWHLGFGTSPKSDLLDGLKPGPNEIGFDYFFGLASNHGSGDGVYLENHSIFGLKSKTLKPFGKTSITESHMTDSTHHSAWMRRFPRLSRKRQSPG